MLMVGDPSASADLKWRLQPRGFARSVNAEKLTFWEHAQAVAQSFAASGTAVRALGTLSPGNITAWRDGRSPC